MLEKTSRELWQRSFGAKPLNDVISYYQHDPEMVSIHLSVPKKRNNIVGYKTVAEGLRLLARELVNDPKLLSVKFVTATSWIVAQHPGIMERLGFSVDLNLDSKFGTKLVRRYNIRRVVNIPKQFRKIEPGHATITREDFLARYLQP